MDKIDQYVYGTDGNITHGGLAYNTLEYIIMHWDKGIRLKHPIQIVANFVYEQSTYQNSEYMEELLMDTSKELVKYYSEDELDDLCYSVLRANEKYTQFIDERFIEIVDTH